MLLSMGNKKIGEGQPVFIVFEAGPTHTGIKSAKLLADHAKKSGADAIKFQITNHEELIHDKGLLFEYDILNSNNERETISEPLIDIWERRWMSDDDWRDLKAHCDKIDLNFFATIFSIEDLNLIKELGCQSIKIASQDTNYRDLIELCAVENLPIQLDTGGSSLGEIERAVDWILDKGNDKIIINHCPSGYPARLESINLRVLQTLKEMFPYPIAFSDHTPGWEMDIAAVSLGADIIEKTITLDRYQKSCEHMMSLEPHEMSSFIKSIRHTEIALGDKRRVLSKEQREKREAIRRSAYLINDVLEGEKFKISDIAFKRPGFGIKPDEYNKFLGLKYKSSLKAGHMLIPEDF
tara:strand:+ start:4689 stop:5744 length:1056 start_codon:yes stop_codon:yes gene_type:complete